MSEKLKRKLKALAKEFSLKYSPKIFNINFVSKKELVMINYIGACPRYKKFGKTSNERIKNIERFFKSNLFKLDIKRQGGCVVSKKSIKNNVAKIKNKKIRKEYEGIVKKIKENLRTVLVSKPVNKKERKFVERIILHEWIHVLLGYNKISLQRIKPDFWKLDEGLVIYIHNHKGLKGP